MTDKPIDTKKIYGAGFHAGVKAAGHQRVKRFPDATEMMLCWNPGTDQVALVRHPDHDHRSDRYDMTTLACNFEIKDKTFEQRKAIVFIEAMHLIVRDKCDPMAVHRALLGLDEYVDGCSVDMPERPMFAY